MRTGRPTPPVVLSAEERQTLEQWARRPTTAQGLAQRARLVLACASSKTNGEIAAAAGVTRQTVGRWRHRFVRKRLPGLLDEPRPGAPRTITDAEVEELARYAMIIEECVRAAPASERDVQALEGPAVHRQSARHRWAVSQPARQSAGAVCG